MLSIIDHAPTVRSLEHALRDRLFGVADRGPEKLALGHQGATFQSRVAWFAALDYWFAFDGGLEGRYWNGFGLGNPFEDRRARSLVVEINPSKNGIDRRVMGAFGGDSDGRVYLCHRGSIRGIGREFLARYPSEGRTTVVDGDRETEVIVVASTEDRDLLSTLRGFVGVAGALKDGQRPVADDVERVLKPRYYPEFSGTTQFRRTEQEVIVDRRHGRVVDALHAALQAKGVAGSNDKNRDLYVVQRNQQLILFEIKTSSETSSCYAAVGQLLWHRRNDSHLVAVFPADLADSAQQRLADLGVSCVLFDWNSVGEGPTFRNLGSVLELLTKA